MFNLGMSVYARRMANRFVNKLSELVELAPDDVAMLEAVTARSRKFGARQDLIREGDRPGPVFVVLEGWACRYKILPNGTRQVMAFLMPGDSCDLHVNILAEMDHSIQAISPATIATISRSEMQAMLDDYPNIARAMYAAQLIDEGTMRAWIVSMGRRSSIERVAHLMCELYVRARGIGLADDDSFAFPLSQLILADALGMTAVHINRVLKELRLRGAMELNRGSLNITDPVALVKIAGFDENYLHRRFNNTT